MQANTASHLMMQLQGIEVRNFYDFASFVLEFEECDCGDHERQGVCGLQMARTEYSNLFNSMEQLYLAFVMKEKFHKIWNEMTL